MRQPHKNGSKERAALPASATLEALRAWVRSVSPPAELIAFVDSETLHPSPALCKNGTDWQPLALPPVHLPAIPQRPMALSLAESRRNAMDDLLFSLGFDHLLALPLEPVGALLLARAQGAFEEHEAESQRPHLIDLGKTLAGLRAGSMAPSGKSAGTEVSILFDLVRDLSRAGNPVQAARSAASALTRLLQPDAGAILLRSGHSEIPEAIAWPEGSPSQWAIQEAARACGWPLPNGEAPGAAADREGWSWRVEGGFSGPVGMALGWRVAVPETAERVFRSVLTSLGLALDRLSVQRRREEDRLRAVVEGLPLGAALVDGECRVRLLNPMARCLLESLGDLPSEGGRLDRIGSIEIGPLVTAALSRQSRSAEFFHPVSGRTLEIQIVGAQQAGAPEVLVLLQDVTGIRQQKAQLARSEKLSALGVLISGIVHEINNPLGTIIGYTELLAQVPADGEQRNQWLKTIQEEAQRCQRIVGNLLAFARPQEPGKKWLSLGAVAEKALSLVAYSLRNARIEAVLEADPDTPAVQADPDAILQLLINLLTNALHAMEGKDGERQVRVEVRPLNGTSVILQVADTGSGIAPESIEKVFDPFFTTKPVGKGTGLGLSLVAATVRDHGGTIDVESEPGRGTCFRIMFPSGAGAQEGAKDLAVRGPAVGRDLAGARVLVVDQQEAVANLLAELLEQAGAVPEVFTEGRKGFERWIAQPPACVIWDLDLADFPVAAFFEELKTGGGGLESQLVLTTRDPQALAQLANRPDPALRILQKPLDLSAVLETVRARITAGSASRPHPGDRPA